MIIDDEPLARKRVRDLLRDESDIRIVGESGDGLDARQKTQALKPDILFLDIKMPGLSGLELSHLLQDDKAPCIIFTTAYAEHAVDAFSLDAVDYLMKPFDKQRFHDALARARKRLAESAPTMNKLEHIVRQLSGLASERSGYSPERLTVKDGTRLKFLVLRDIIRMQSDGDYLHIHAVGGEHTMIRERMHVMQQRLDNMPFVRISRSALINFDQVREIKPTPHGDYEFILNDGERLTSGKTYREAIRTWLGRMNSEKQQ